MKIQEKKLKKRRLSVIVTNVMDCWLIDEQIFCTNIGKKIKKKTKIQRRIKNLHFGSEQGILH
jgi:hypothetical protein